MQLFKTTITIYTTFDPTNKLELVELAQEATDGEAICDTCEAVPVFEADIPEGVLSFFSEYVEASENSCSQSVIITKEA